MDLSKRGSAEVAAVWLPLRLFPMANAAALTAWVFLPNHWHAILYPAYPLAIGRVMELIKDAATNGLTTFGRRRDGDSREKPKRLANCANLCATLLYPEPA